MITGLYEYATAEVINVHTDNYRNITFKTLNNGCTVMAQAQTPFWVKIFPRPSCPYLNACLYTVQPGPSLRCWYEVWRLRFYNYLLSMWLTKL